jgi:hypothetical protein
MTGNVVRTFDDVQTRRNDARSRTLTATATGANIDADAEFTTVTSTDATYIVKLPAAVNGKEMRLFVVATGCELRSAVAADKVNNVVVGATNEAALVAAVEYTLVYNATTSNWVMTGKTALGAATTPVVPDAV